MIKDPSLLSDYAQKVENGSDIITEDGMFYYGIALRMSELGYSSFDSTTFYEYLSDKESLKDGFDERGGYKTVSDICGLINVDNIDGYYDNLVKSNLLIRLNDRGFNVLPSIEKFQNMTSNQVYDYFDYSLNDICSGKIEKMNVNSLSDGYDEAIDEWDTGSSVGIEVGYPLLMNRLAGVHSENLLLHLGHIGNGKTTTALLFYIIPAIKAGVDCMIMGNEQTLNDFRQMMIASVLYNEIGYFGMNRQKIVTGHFNAEQKAKLHDAAEWLKKQSGKVYFAELNDYGTASVNKLIRKYAKLGVSLFLYDTAKPLHENDDKAWAEFSEVMKNLFVTAKKEKIALIATAQLSAESMSRKFLDLSCTGKSRSISETATQVVMFRTLQETEKDHIKAYIWKRMNPEDPKSKYVKTFVDLRPDSQYIVLFTPKNRFGPVAPQILYERNMDFNTMREVGYVDIQYDGFTARK